MSGGPNFDELVGAEPAGAERDRLRHAHEQLLLAGPPPELTPRLEKTPEPDNVRTLPRRAMKHRAAILIAAAFLVLLVFFAGYAIGGSHGNANQPVETLDLTGTHIAPHARATLDLLPATAGNWPMTLHVTGLQRLPAGSLYEVYLVRDGKRWGSCGSFVVGGSTQDVSVPLNAPYKLQRGDTWIVTRETPAGGAGATVLKPA